MSKVTSSNYPNYNGSSVSIGDSIASTGVNNGVLTSDYQMSDSESLIYNYALSALASILPSVNTFDADTLNSIKSGVDAYKNTGIADINSLYNSSLSNLENDAASRFGNLDNSIFGDNLSNLESERSKAVSSFAQDVLAKQSELESDELTKRYSLINLLNGLTDDIYSRALSTISAAMTGSTNANNYNSNLYDALSSMQKTGSGGSNTTNSLLSSLLNASGSSLSSIFTL